MVTGLMLEVYGSRFDLMWWAMYFSMSILKEHNYNLTILFLVDVVKDI